MAAGPTNASGFWSGAANGPFSRLHLGEPTNNAQQWGYRPWQRNGVAITGNNDQMYIGHKYTYAVPTNYLSGELLDFSDAVIQWSDNPGTTLGDRMRFLFTSSYTGAATGNGSLEGLEGMRLKPVENGTEIHVGIGDFHAAAADPDERLDILSRTIRLRNFALPSTAYKRPNLQRVLVVDSLDGRVYWRNLPMPVGGGTDCDWYSSGLGSDTYTAVNSTNVCPQEANNVGIGTMAPIGKLHVVQTPLGGGGDRAVYIQADHPGGAAMHGILSLVSGALHSIGLQGEASNGSTCKGLEAIANNGSTLTIGASGKGNGASPQVIGLNGEAFGSGGAMAIGVKGCASGGSVNWAGHFCGDVWVNGQNYSNGIAIPSDASIKTNVQPLAGASAMLQQLSPSTYEHNTLGQSLLNAPIGTQIGLIADSVAGVVPSVVSSLTIPAEYDSAGTLINAPMPILAIDYAKLVPVLIGGWQEQQAVIGSLQTTVATLQAIVTGCCVTNDGGNLNSLPGGGSNGASSSGDQRLMVHPNPFTERTAIAYALDRDAAISMTVMSVSGQLVSTLDLGLAQAGLFTYEWNTSGMAPGQYIVSLLADGEVDAVQVVKLEH